MVTWSLFPMTVPCAERQRLWNPKVLGFSSLGSLIPPPELVLLVSTLPFKQRPCFIYPEHGFSTLALLAHETRSFFAVGAVLCTVRWLAAPPAAVSEVPVAPPPNYDNQNCL